MATSFRRHSASVIEALGAEPYRFEFFQAVRILSRAAHNLVADDESDLAHLRFRTSLSLAFPASEIQGFKRQPAPEGSQGAEGEQDSAELRVSFLGLVGPSGVLPAHYTQHLLERQIYHRDYAAHDFLDIFNHRLISHFFRAWRKYRLHLQYERDRVNGFTPLVMSLAGLGLPSMRAHLASEEGGVPEDALAYFAGLLGQQTRPARNIAQILGDYFNVPVEIEQFAGRWIEVAGQEQTVLGGGNACLGKTAFVGAKTWDRSSMLRLRIGPLSRERFEDFLPGQPAAKALKQLVKLLTGFQFDYDVKLILRRADVTPAGFGAGGCMLGWNSRLMTRPAEADAAQAGYVIAV